MWPTTATFVALRKSYPFQASASLFGWNKICLNVLWGQMSSSVPSDTVWDMVAPSIWHKVWDMVAPSVFVILDYWVFIHLLLSVTMANTTTKRNLEEEGSSVWLIRQVWDSKQEWEAEIMKECCLLCSLTHLYSFPHLQEISPLTVPQTWPQLTILSGQLLKSTIPLPR